MPGVVHFKATNRCFECYGAGTQIASLVGPKISRKMGKGVPRLDPFPIVWTMPGDALIATLEGAYHLRVGDTAHDYAPEDVLWVPAQTPLNCEGVGATVFHSPSPVDWRVGR
jgi:ethanolamine utilization protein EutQ (cupin superfamily)